MEEKQNRTNKTSFAADLGSFLNQRCRLQYFALLLKLKDRCSAEFLIFSAHLVTMKCKGFTTISTREVQLCAWPATQLTHSPLLPANPICQSLCMCEYLSETHTERGLLAAWLGLEFPSKVVEYISWYSL